MTVLLTVCFSGAVGILFLTTLYALDLAVKKHNLSAAYKALCLGTIITAVCYFIPFYCDYFAVTAFGSSFAKSFFLSVHHAIRLFFVDVNYDELRCFATDFGLLGDLYTSFGILLFILAPVLTFTFAVSFLQEASTVVRVWFSPRKDYYIFSEMNLQSVYLAKDIRMQNPDVNIVFLGVNKDDRSEYEQIKTYARSIHAVLLPTDCVQINSLMARYKRNAHFFLIGENEEENVVIAIAILEHTPHASKREIYVRLSQSDHLLDNLPTYENTAVFRVEHTYSLVVHNLEELDTRLFETATPDGNGDNVISVLVVGLGCCGTEMLKALSWFTQVEGYTTRIHAFEQDPAAIEKFEHLCPGFFGENRADCHCEIVIHPGLSYGTSTFDRELVSVGNVGYVFVALGEDNLNVNAALDIRKILAGTGQHPIIQAILRNADAGRLISGSRNYRGTSYDIEFIGSYEEMYSLEFITDARSKEAVINEHLKWANAESAHACLSHEEQYRMTKSYILHQKVLEVLDVPQDERARAEHRRWVNLFFSEGYVYGPKRDDIAKHHPVLVAYDDLPDKCK